MSKSVKASGSELYFTGISLIVLCITMLFFILMAWWFGGDDYKDSIFGNYAIPILLLGIAAGVAIKHVNSRRRQAES